MTPTPLPNEGPRPFAAFKIYVEDGPKRSIRRCARKLGKSSTIIARWSVKFHWQKRLRELELEDAKRAAAAAERAAASVALEREREAMRHTQRKLKASERLFKRAHEILQAPMDGSRPADSARMFVVAAELGNQALGVGGTSFGLNPTGGVPIIHVSYRRDAQSDVTEQNAMNYLCDVLRGGSGRCDGSRKPPDAPDKTAWARKQIDQLQARRAEAGLPPLKPPTLPPLDDDPRNRRAN